MRELDPRRPAASERGPQSEDHPASLEEHDLVIGLLRAAPSKGLIERPGAGEIFDPKRHQTDALLHLAKYVV